jgi:hypothetical protein
MRGFRRTFITLELFYTKDQRTKESKQHSSLVLSLKTNIKKENGRVAKALAFFVKGLN